MSPASEDVEIEARADELVIRPSVITSLIYLLAPLPAVLVGALLMHRHDVGATLWSQQIGTALIGTIACIGAAVIARPARERPLRWAIVAVLAVAMVAVTLAFPGVEGVRRWIPAGPLQLHAAAIALPVLLLAVGAAIRGTTGPRSWTVQGLAVLAVLALVAQPDSSQATAFGVSAAVLILLHDGRRTAAWLVAVATVGLAMFAWTRPDPLQPVPHVEGIVGLAAATGGVWLAMAILSLALLPLPFLHAAVRGTAPRGIASALAVYFGLLCVMPAFGAFPVPLMGFGLSPVLGYYAALAWLVTQQQVRRHTSPRYP